MRQPWLGCLPMRHRGRSTEAGPLSGRQAGRCGPRGRHRGQSLRVGSIVRSLPECPLSMVTLMFPVLMPLILPWRPHSVGCPSPTPSLPLPSAPEVLSSATRSLGTRTPACHPPGQGHLVPPRKGPLPPSGSPTWGICKDVFSLSPHPDSREALGRRDQHHGPQKRLPLPRRSSPGHSLERSTRSSSSALPLVFPCWKSQIGNKTLVDSCHCPQGRGCAWAVNFSAAKT